MDTLRSVSAAFLADRHDLAAFLIGLVRDPVLAEDVLQDTWVKLAETVQAGETIANVPAWCRTVAKHAAIRQRRLAGRLVAGDERIADLVASAFDEAAPEPAWPQRVGALRGCLDRLDATARRLLEERYVSGRAPESIAEGAASTADAINMRLMRLRRALKRCVGARLAREDER